MEASASTRASATPLAEATPHAVAPAQTTEQRNDRRLPMVFLGSVLAIYMVIGLAIYVLITSLT